MNEMRSSSSIPKKCAPPTVLVVDDEALIRWSLAETLREEGYAVVEAGDARAALAAIAIEGGEPFDVVLLDYRLPDSGDLGLLAAIKRLAPSSRVIMITAYTNPELAAGAMALGAFWVVSKPFEVETVAALVGRARVKRTADVILG